MVSASTAQPTANRRSRRTSAGTGRRHRWRMTARVPQASRATGERFTRLISLVNYLPMSTARTAVDAAADPSEVAARLRLSATRLARRLRQQADAGLTPSQLSALAVIDVHGPLTLGSLADHERVAPPSITKLVNKLEAEGLIQRTTDLADRRITRVATSAQGASLLAESRRRKTAWLTSRIGQLDADAQQRLAAALDVLDALASEERP